MSDELGKALRKAVENYEKGHNELSRETGIPQPTITRFVNGTDLRLSNASILAKFFGMRLTKPKGQK